MITGPLSGLPMLRNPGRPVPIGAGGSGWLFGSAAVAMTVFISQALAPLPAMRISLPGLLRFLGFFFRGSLAGGADVARRALAPGLPLSIHRYRHRLRRPARRAPCSSA